MEYTKKSPIKYAIEKPDKKYVIFTEAFNENWELGFQKPANFIAVDLYEFKDNFILKYTRFNVYLVSYIISIVMLLFLLALILQNRWIDYGLKWKNKLMRKRKRLNRI